MVRVIVSQAIVLILLRAQAQLDTVELRDMEKAKEKREQRFEHDEHERERENRAHSQNREAHNRADQGIAESASGRDHTDYFGGVRSGLSLERAMTPEKSMGIQAQKMESIYSQYDARPQTSELKSNFPAMPNDIAEHLVENNIPLEKVEEYDLFPKGKAYGYRDGNDHVRIFKKDKNGNVEDVSAVGRGGVADRRRSPRYADNRLVRRVRGAHQRRKNFRGQELPNVGVVSMMMRTFTGALGFVGTGTMVMMTPSFMGIQGDMKEQWETLLNVGSYKVGSDGNWDLSSGALGANDNMRDACGNYIDMIEWNLLEPDEQHEIENNGYLGAPCLSRFKIDPLNNDSAFTTNNFDGCPINFKNRAEYLSSKTDFYDYDPVTKKTKTFTLFNTTMRNNAGQGSSMGGDQGVKIFYDCHGNEVDVKFKQQPKGTKVTQGQEGFFITPPDESCTYTTNTGNSSCLTLARYPKDCQSMLQDRESRPKGFMDKVEACYQPASDYRLWRTLVAGGQLKGCLENNQPCKAWSLGTVVNPDSLHDPYLGPSPSLPFYWAEDSLMKSEILSLTGDVHVDEGTPLTKLKRPSEAITDAIFFDYLAYPPSKKDKYLVEAWWCNVQRDLADSVSKQMDLEKNKLITFDAQVETLDEIQDLSELQVQGAKQAEDSLMKIINLHPVYTNGDQCTYKYWADYYQENPTAPMSATKGEIFSRASQLQDSPGQQQQQNPHIRRY